MEEEQLRLAALVEIIEDSIPIDFQPDDLIFTTDIQYVGEAAFVAVDIRRYDGTIVGIFGGESLAGMPYIPRFFCFREGPPLQHILEKTMRETGLQPKVILVDGHGVAHPLRLGVASWLGVKMGIPTVGIAKDTLLQYSGTLGAAQGSTLDVLLEGEVLGKVLRTQTNVNPIYVSVGHRFSLAASLHLALHFAGKYRLPEPIRSADHAARQLAILGAKND